MKKGLKKGIWLAILIIVIAMTLVSPLAELDEIWNYNFARNIVDGNLPYKDFNMVVMPFLPNICAIFLSFLGNEMIVMRIVGIILWMAILITIDKILQCLKVAKEFSFGTIIFLIILLSQNFKMEYNFFVLFLTLLIILLELLIRNKPKNNGTKMECMIGILAGIAFCSKQTTGLFLMSCVVLYQILEVRNKKDWKLFFEKIKYRMIGIAIPIIVLILYFTMNHVWNDWFNYCILGVTEFSNHIPYSYLMKKCDSVTKIASIVIPLFLVGRIFYVIHKRKEKEDIEYQNQLILTCFSIVSLSVVYPISDFIHFWIGAIPSIIGMIYCFFIEIRKVKNKQIVENAKKTVDIILVVVIISVLIAYTNLFIQTNTQKNDLNHFDYIPIQEELLNEIHTVMEYIQEQEKEVYILDAEAAVYKIPMNQYDKNYDMLLKGNLGQKGEEKIIQELEEKSNIVVLLKKENARNNWQNSKKIREYVLQNMKKVEEIEEFDSYEK